MRHDRIGVPLRRDEALDRLVKTGSSPSYLEISQELDVSVTRAQELVKQLIDHGMIEKTPGAQRALRVRDVSQARYILDQFARSLGWAVAPPLEELQPPIAPGVLPMLPPLEHLPEV